MNNEAGEVSQFAAGLAGRLRNLVRSIDRLDRLESGTGAWTADFYDHEAPQAAEEIALRAFRTAAEPTNFRILKALSQQSSRPVSDLTAATGLTRLPLSERLNDLVQVGLAARLIETDHAQITAAGAGILRIVTDIIDQIIQEIENER